MTVAAEQTTTIPVLVTRIEEIAPGIPLDTVAETIWKLDFIKEKVREAEQQLKERLIEYIETLPEKEIRIGPKLYYVGDEKKEKDKSVRKTAEAVFIKAGGDFDNFCSCLSSNAFKPGATRKILGDEFKDYFQVTYEKKLKADGTEQKQLQVINTDFIK